MKPLHVAAAVRALAVLCLAAGLVPTSWAQSRGELLYNTHCVACHRTQIHWRDKRQVVDWPSLRAQVRLWQATELLAWDEADIESVARYLNDTYYRYPLPTAPAGTAQRLSGPTLARR
ncbi:MAG TPA: cytochrome C [Rubrivivax sp.]|nr:cytochrome C [Rubrivivax sp.]